MSSPSRLSSGIAIGFLAATGFWFSCAMTGGRDAGAQDPATQGVADRDAYFPGSEPLRPDEVDR